jgi:hypothetical protein
MSTWHERLDDDASTQRFFALFRAIKHVAVGNWWILGCFDFAEIEDKSRSVLSGLRRLVTKCKH